jgi:DNA (cytosine-5)-methyltransferase 1
MLRVIREIQPEWVVGENVFGLVNWNGGLVFNEVQTDLEAAGYEVQPYVLPACAVNAPHRRERVWFVAYSNKCTTGPSRTSARTFGCWSGNNDEPKSGREQTEQCFGHGNVHWTDTNTDNAGLQRSEKHEGITSSRTNRNEQSAGFFRPTWDKFPTQSPVRGGNDGIPTQLDGITFPKHRNESIKAYGNSVIPQLVFQIFKTIDLYENGNSL